MIPLLQPMVLAIAFLSLTLVIWAIPETRNNVRARLFLVLMAEVFIYTFGYSQELIQTTPAGILFWSRFQYLGVAFIPASILQLTFHFRFYRENLPLSPKILLFRLPSLITLISHWSAPAGRLYYREWSVAFTDTIPVISHIRGPVYYMHMSYVVLALAVSLGLYGWMALKNSGRSRKGFFYLMLGSLVPGIGYITFMMGIYPEGLDVNPIFMSLVGPFFAYGILTENLVGNLRNGKAKFFEESPQPVFIFNKEGLLIDWNRAASHILNQPRLKTLNKPWEDLLRDWDAQEIHHNGAELRHQTEILRDDKIYASQKLPFTDDRKETRGFLIILSDITELKKSVANLKTAAQTDGLTGTYNRKTWEELAGEALRHAGESGAPGSILMIDLDHFKLVNDSHGHQTGDQVIKEVARRLQAVLRDKDILGRYGGEEFCLWLADTGPEAALKVSRRCCDAVEFPPLSTHTGELTVTISVGFSSTEKVASDDLEAFIRRADKALYRAKSQGRNQVVQGEAP